MATQLVVDTREGKEKIVKLIQKSEIPYRLEKLEICDYAIGDSILIERKTIQDFYSSTISGHLSEQLKNMSLNPDIKMIIAIIGDYEDLYWGGIKSNQNIFYGMISSIIAKYKFSILHFKRETQFVNFLSRCIDKLDGEIDFTKIKRLDNKDNVELSILCALPNISRERAERILEKFNVKLVLLDKNDTPIDMIGTSTLLQDIDGIGKKIANNLEKHFY